MKQTHTEGPQGAYIRPGGMSRKTVKSTVNRQLLLREVNDRLLELAADDVGEFICECAAPECVDRILVPVDDYRRLRRDGTRFIVDSRNWFIVAAWHADRAHGHIVERHEDWCVIMTGFPELMA